MRKRADAFKLRNLWGIAASKVLFQLEHECSDTCYGIERLTSMCREVHALRLAEGATHLYAHEVPMEVDDVL